MSGGAAGRVSRRLLSSRPATSAPRHYDVAIAGGGAVGSVLARLLLDDASRSRPIRVALLERRPSPPTMSELGGTAAAPSARAYALSPASLSYIGPGPLRSLLRHNRCGVYDSMQVWEHDGPAQLHFVGDDLRRAIDEGRLADPREQLGGEGGKGPWLGAVVEDAPLVSALWEELRKDERIDLLDNVVIKSIESPRHEDVGKLEPPSQVELSYTDVSSNEEDAITANLLVAADGANSFVRRTVGGFPMMTKSYGRKAVTCTVEISSGMNATAFQRFLPHGPIALLPVWGDGGDGGVRYANVVWSTTASEADHLRSLPPDEFIRALNHHLREGPNVNPPIFPGAGNLPPVLGTVAREVDSLLRTANTALTMGTWTESPARNFFRMPPESVRVVGPVMGFDLTASHVVTSGRGDGRTGGYAAPRVALVGDAAHTMHPMAGQGLNLGLGDAHSLSNLVKEAIDSGMDVGGTSLFLDRYNLERLVQGFGTVGGVHALHEVFGVSGSMPGSVIDSNYGSSKSSLGGLQSLIGYSRSMGMNTINSIGPVRRMLAEAAAGARPFKGYASAQ